MTFQLIRNNGEIDIRTHFLNENRATLSDFLYLPAEQVNYFANWMELFVEAQVFVETAFGKIMDSITYTRQPIFFLKPG